LTAAVAAVQETLLQVVQVQPRKVSAVVMVVV
jgi:hypothetical protein